MSKPYIPPDILAGMLIRLPVESIIRFRCVSEAWNSLICSASFVSTQTHFATSFARKPNILLLGNWDDQPMDDEYKKLGIPLKGLGVRVNGSCHGMVCLSSSICFIPSVNNYCSINTIVLWNPALRIFLQLPEFSLKTPDHFHDILGLGFDVKRNDYKVIRIPMPSEGVPRQYEIFELSQNAWKIVTPNKSPPDLFGLPPVYLKGSTHWISKLCTSIVAFDFVEEAFLEMNLPGPLNNLDPELVRIVVKDEQYLSAIFYSLYTYEGNAAICVWVMKEYGVKDSWSKLFTIHDTIMGHLEEPICFRTNGELLVRTMDNMLVSYDCSTDTETIVEYDCLLKFVVEHMETLALLLVPGTSKIK